MLLAPVSLPAASGQHSDHKPERILAGIALHRWQQERLAARGETQAVRAPSPVEDQGNLAVVEADSTILVEANAFDLARKSLRLTPNSDGTYRVTAGTTQFDSAAAEAGSPIRLQDDDTSEITLGFSFPFFGQTYSSVFLNSDGNLTFTQGDVATSERDLTRFLAGVPRIAPFFEDLNPSEGGGRVTVTMQPGRVIFSWIAVPLCCEADRSPPIPKQTFQAIFAPDGSVEFVYGAVEGASAVIGLSPGRVATPPTLVDLSAQNGSQSFTGPIAEVFTQRQSLSEIGVARKFYATHEDAYDFLVIWVNFVLDLGSDGGLITLAFADTVRNDVSGIGPFGSLGSAFDFTEEVGSAGRVGTVIQMGSLATYPDNPRDVSIRNTDSTLSIIGQEAGHRWLVRFRYPFENNPRSTALLGRSDAHWGFFFNSEASVMEGHEIRDNGDGSFTTVGATSRYGSLDHYAMGLRRPAEVPATFLVTNASIPTPFQHFPRLGSTFQGTKFPVTIDKIIEANGPRLPTATVAQKDFNFAFILVIKPSSAPAATELAKLERFRTEWEKFWSEATGNRSGARTSLVRAARISPLPAATPAGGSLRATLTLASPAPSGGVIFTLQSSDTSIANVPASVTVAAGGTSASFQITGGSTGVATLTATADGYETIGGAVVVGPAATFPVVPAGSAVNGASFTPATAVSPGSIISLFGSNLSDQALGASSLPLPTTLSATSVLIDGFAAPLFYVSPGQVNAQVPFEMFRTLNPPELQSSTAQLVVNRGDVATTAIPLALALAAPGIFTLSQNGTGPAAVLHAADSTPVGTNSPARAGESISIFATGLGAVTTAVPTGYPAPTSGTITTRQTPQVTIGGAPATVSFSGLAPGFVGLYQLNVQVPGGISGTTLPLVVTMNGVPSNTATIAVQ